MPAPKPSPPCESATAKQPIETLDDTTRIAARGGSALAGVAHALAGDDASPLGQRGGTYAFAARTQLGEHFVHLDELVVLHCTQISRSGGGVTGWTEGTRRSDVESSDALQLPGVCFLSSHSIACCCSKTELFAAE